MQPGDRFGDESRFIITIGALHHLYRLTGTIARPQRLGFALAIVFDDRIGGGQDISRGAIVLLQHNFPCGRKVLCKRQDVIYRSTTPRVNSLVVVADRTYILFGAGQCAHQVELVGAGILILVH